MGYLVGTTVPQRRWLVLWATLLIAATGGVLPASATVRLTDVTFMSASGSTNFFPVKRDTDGWVYAGASGQHWHDADGDGVATGPQDYMFPVCYTQSTTPKVQVVMSFDAPLTTPVYVCGSWGSMSVNFYDGAPVVGSNTITATMQGQSALPSGAQHSTSSSISWYVWQGSGPWVQVGTSSNEVFRVLGTPPDESRYRTVLYLATQNGGSTASQCRDNTWSMFTSRGVSAYVPQTASYSRALHYYQSPDTQVYTTTGLLSQSDGQCIAWARLLRDAMKANGVSGLVITRISQLSYTAQFAIKNITFDATADYPLDAPWQYSYSDLDLLPPPSTSEGIGGQNMSTPTQKAFTQHFVLHDTSGGRYYDPSYGQSYADATSFSSAAIGAWLSIHREPGFWLQGDQQWHWAWSSAPVAPIFTDDSSL